MCEPSCIKYTKGSTFTCSDKATARAVAKRTYESAVELFAHLCKQYKLVPLKDIVSHSEGYKKGIASNHGDPEHLWKQLGLPYTMDTFRKAVNLLCTESSSQGGTDVLYCVQVGAYVKKSNAEAMMERLKRAGFDGIILKK